MIKVSVGGRRRFVFDIPQTQMFKDLFHELLIIDQ